MFGSEGAGAKGTTTLKGIGWLMHPLEDQLHPGKGGKKIPKGGKVSWQKSSPPPHLVWQILTGIRWRVLPMTPPLPGHGDRR